MYIRVLLRFEFHISDQILYTTLATDEKWSLSRFHISYQKLEISWQKMDKFLENKLFFEYFFSKNFVDKSLYPSFISFKENFFLTNSADFGPWKANKASFFIGGQSCVQDLMWNSNLKRSLMYNVHALSGQGVDWKNDLF